MRKFSELLNISDGLRPELSNIEISNGHVFPQFVTPGDLFIALPSESEEIETLKIYKAIEQGAKIIIKRETLKCLLPAHVISVEVYDTRKALSEIAYNLAPSQPEIIVGITGTCGKTSTTSFINQLWHHLGVKSASFSTLGLKVAGNDNFKPPTITKAYPKTLIHHYYLEALARNHITHLAYEVTSAMLDQFKADNIRFKAGVYQF
jgi:UDP-N-acetylmuramoyl-L-alanyl-D-glutamate--2,6-diaminopimelate ligase